MATKTAMDLDEPAEERDEPKVEALPRFGREVLNYLEPRVGIDGLSMFRCCGSCQSFVPEAHFSGAVLGNRCAILGSQMPVSDDNYCNHYTPWSSGIPCEDIVCMNAGELRRGVPPAISPSAAGYAWDTGHKRQCGCCKFSDANEPGLAAGSRECEMFECLNTEYPSIFDLDKRVDWYGGCSLFQTQPDPIVPALPPARRMR